MGIGWDIHDEHNLNEGMQEETTPRERLKVNQNLPIDGVHRLVREESDAPTGFEIESSTLVTRLAHHSGRESVCEGRNHEK